MESLFRFINGYVIIEISKSGFARFMNLCLQEHLDIWDINESSYVITCHMSLKDFGCIQNCVKRSHVKIHIINKIGLPFCLKHLRSGIPWLIGFLFCLCVFYYQKTHIWTFCVTGNSSISDEQIKDVLTTNGLCAGMKISEFDSDLTEEILCNEFDKISWICVSLDGTEISVSLIENIEKTYQDNNLFPSSIYAERDGIIERIMVSNGYTELKVGDEVKKGQLLISGDVPYENNDGITVYKQVAAQGDYLCRIKEPYFDSVNLIQPLPFYEKISTNGFRIVFNRESFGVSYVKNRQDTLYSLKTYHDLNFLSLIGINIYFVKEEQAVGFIDDVCITENKQLIILNQNLEYRINNLIDSGATNIVKELSVSKQDNQIILFGNIFYSDSSVSRRRIPEKKDEEAQNVSNSTYDGFIN